MGSAVKHGPLVAVARYLVVYVELQIFGVQFGVVPARVHVRKFLRFRKEAL